MISLLSRLFGGILRTLLLCVILVVVLVGAAYGWYASSRLNATLKEAGVKPGYTASYQLLGRSQARIQTAYPFTARVFVKATKTHNWIPTERHGLVCAILQWSPDQRRWVVEPAEGLAPELRLKLELMIRNPTNGGLIEALKDQDPRVREVAFRELTIRTSQDFGYRPDAPEGRRQAAIVQWEQWWATNKVSWTTDKVLDTLQELVK